MESARGECGEKISSLISFSMLVRQHTSLLLVGLKSGECSTRVTYTTKSNTFYAAL